MRDLKNKIDVSEQEKSGRTEIYCLFSSDCKPGPAIFMYVISLNSNGSPGNNIISVSFKVNQGQPHG